MYDKYVVTWDDEHALTADVWPWGKPPCRVFLVLPPGADVLAACHTTLLRYARDMVRKRAADTAPDTLEHFMRGTVFVAAGTVGTLQSANLLLLGGTVWDEVEAWL